MTCSDDPIPEYHLGQEITIFADFADKDGVAGNPDAVILRVLQGDGSTIVDILQASLSNPSTGRWEYDLIIPLDGDQAKEPWMGRFEGSSAPGGITAADETRWEAIPSPFYPES